MAGEKTKPRVEKRPNQATPVAEPSITMTTAQLQEFMSEAFKNALSMTPQVTPQVKQDLNENLTKSLAARINAREVRGKRFFEEMASVNGPRKRIVIDKIYREFAGKEITSTVNGSTVKVPVDGQAYWVHPAHYEAIKWKLKCLSEARDREVAAPDMFQDPSPGDYQKIEK